MTERRTFVDRPIPSFAQLCVMMHHVLDRVGADAPPSEIIGELKDDIAHAGFGNPPPHHFIAVADAVVFARAKGYATPRQPSRSLNQKPARRAS